MFLLGAGASAEAGIPLTGPMGLKAVEDFTALSPFDRGEEKWAVELLYASLLR